ncbi:CBF-domain-containing protein [Gigaspora margarita]|uniref:CBF-domain-containing protein n=1 Tax=Gigaspora margarita TaxID=4874 RepID=A0A8H4EL37_GIGMA|nr:CBF-domain-containing protein [Gigaspora margarita]
MKDKCNLADRNDTKFSTLLESLENKSPDVIYDAMYALYRAFVPLLSMGELQKPKKIVDQNAAVMCLRDSYIHYVNKLCLFLNHEEPGLQVPSLNILLDLLKIESIYLTTSSGAYYFSNNHFYRIVEGLIDNENFNEHLQTEFIDKYWNKYDDLRFYFLKNAAKIINLATNSGKPKDRSGPISKKKRTNERLDDNKLNNLMENTFSILENLRSMPTDASEIKDFWIGHPTPEIVNKQTSGNNEEEFKDISDEDGGHDMNDKKSHTKSQDKIPPILQLSSHRRVFSDCWLALLKLPMKQESYKKILLIMHKKIIPHMLQPTMLMDYLTESYNAGGAISLLALNGLFTLIHEHNLDYPDFYKKLYNLFDRNLMHVKYRSRFFRLVDLFLSSTHLPVQLVASFIKRMSRLSLTSPPHGIVILIPLIYNLIRRHPSCMVLIHRPYEIKSRTEDGGHINNISEDPYVFDEPDPMNSNAIASSLWELKTLQNHYLPNVATLAKIFQDKFNKPSYNLEDFLDHTYATLFEAETSKKPKKTPALAFEKPNFVFPVCENINNTEQIDAEYQELRNANIMKGWEIFRF